MAFKFSVAATSDCPPEKNCSTKTIKIIFSNFHSGIPERERVLGACHDSGNSRGDSLPEKSEGAVSNLFWCGLVLALSTRSDHAGLEKDTFKHDIVLSQVEEHLCPHLLGHFEGPVDPMLTVEQDLWLNNWYQSIVLNKIIKAFQQKKKSHAVVKTFFL